MRVIIFRAFDSLDDPKSKVTADGIRGRRDRLIEGLASRVMLYARDVAGAAYDAGYQARTRTPDVIASSVVSTLRSGRAD
jgi:hypothetical protein